MGGRVGVAEGPPGSELEDLKEQSQLPRSWEGFSDAVRQGDVVNAFHV